MVTRDARNLFEVAIPQSQKQLAVLGQKPVGPLIEGGIVRAAFPARRAPVHHFSTRHEAKLLREVSRTISLLGSTTFVTPIRRRSAKARVVNEHHGLIGALRIGKHIADIEVERFGLTEARAMQQQRDEHVPVVVPIAGFESLEQQFREALLRERWWLIHFDSWQASVSRPMSSVFGGGVDCPRVPQKRM